MTDDVQWTTESAVYRGRKATTPQQLGRVRSDPRKKNQG